MTTEECAIKLLTAYVSMDSNSDSLEYDQEIPYASYVELACKILEEYKNGAE